MKWSSDDTLHFPLLFTANSDNQIKVYNMDIQSKEINQYHYKSINEAVPSLCLSLDKCNDNRTLLVSDSNGHLTTIDAESMNIIMQWKGHSFEAWTVTFHHHNQHIIISGGDDCMMNVWDTRCNIISPSNVGNRRYSDGPYTVMNM
jgi:diphthamide biosynthesis protein 7